MKRISPILILSISIALASASCKKEKENEPSNYHILKGRIMEDCNTPYASKKIRLSGDNALSDPFSVDEFGNSEFYTDANGNFEIKYAMNGNWGILYAPYKVMTQIPIGAHKSLDIGEVNLNCSVSFLIKLQANSPFTSNDTLIIPDYNGNNPNDQIKIAGPFSTDVIDTVFNREFSNYPLQYITVPRSDVNFYFTGFGELRFLNFDTPFCQNNFSEVTIILE